MAQKQLSPVLQTRKINSLPKDLRKIADELLIEKFGEDDTVKEVRKKSSSSFPGDGAYGIRVDKEFGLEMGYFGSSESYARFDGSSDITYVGNRRMDRPGISTRLDISTRSRVATTPICTPDFRGLIEALRTLDEQNLPRHGRVFRLSPGFWNELKRQSDVGIHVSFGRTQTLLGCDISVEPSNCNEVEVRF